MDGTYSADTVSDTGQTNGVDSLADAYSHVLLLELLV
jgi:hypothetical protein